LCVDQPGQHRPSARGKLSGKVANSFLAEIDHTKHAVDATPRLRFSTSFARHALSHVEPPEAQRCRLASKTLSQAGSENGKSSLAFLLLDAAPTISAHLGL
jgi:hypothetical protein